MGIGIRITMGVTQHRKQNMHSMDAGMPLGAGVGMRMGVGMGTGVDMGVGLGVGVSVSASSTDSNPTTSEPCPRAYCCLTSDSDRTVGPSLPRTNIGNPNNIGITNTVDLLTEY